MHTQGECSFFLLAEGGFGFFFCGAFNYNNEMQTHLFV